MSRIRIARRKSRASDHAVPDLRRTPHGSGLGKVRRVVERTLGWLKGL